MGSFIFAVSGVLNVMVSTTSVQRDPNKEVWKFKKSAERQIVGWSDIPLLPLSNFVSRLECSREKHALLSVCRNWNRFIVKNPVLWKKFEISTENCARSKQFSRNRKFLKQFGRFIKELNITGVDRDRRYQKTLTSFILNIDLTLTQLAKQGSRLTSLSISDLSHYVARAFSSDFSQMSPGWAKQRKLTSGFTKYCEVFEEIMRKFAASEVYRRSLRTLILRNTRFENRQGLHLLDILIPCEMNVETLDIAAYFVHFHHLPDESQITFHDILFNHLSSITTLRVDHNMLSQEFLTQISSSWKSHLRQFDIEVQDSYRNIRYAALMYHRSDPISWDLFNRECCKCNVSFTFGGRRPNSYRTDQFCDHDDNYLTTVMLASKCKRISALSFIRTDYETFVNNVALGYECMSSQYRHYQAFKNSSIAKFIKGGYLVPFDSSIFNSV